MDYCTIPTPVGAFLVAGSDGILHRTGFETGRRAPAPAADWREDASAMRFAVEQIEQYFAGERTAFELELAVDGTEFQREVWHEVAAIPFGRTRSYGEIAGAIGRPGASRAVGAANGANKLPLVIPCHRVIGGDRSLTGFGGGLDVKRRLLEFEGARQSGLFS